MILLRNNLHHFKDSLTSGVDRGGGDSLIKVGTDVQAPALSISGVNFCPGIRFWEVHFAQTIGFWQFLTKRMCKIDKRVKEVTYLLKIFNFGTLKVIKTCPVISFWALFCPGIRYFGKFCPG